ncbi:NUDIX domain-containing protein [Alteribacter natronophilus]|uniref:NUDIX domain-containing protein n=1 Tax=Alteribacter natronophilus TaxID=2583810 RepID=UPI00110DD7C8|nr:NUDIX domain-containing protein [Alteribacter natronophilus]TMW71001.1 NUDIX domain-containing protein [Alteribacter natronophilus]
MNVQAVINHESRNQIEKYLHRYSEEKHIHSLFSFAIGSKELFSASALPAHITAAGIVLSQNEPGSILMVCHNCTEWMLPGGHVHPGELPQEAAKRIIADETAMEVALHRGHLPDVFPADIRIRKMAETEEGLVPSHYHYEFCYVFLTRSALPEHRVGNNRILWGDGAGVPGMERVLRKTGEPRFCL